MANNKMLVGALLDTLKIGLSKDNLNNKKELASFVLDTESMDPMVVESSISNIDKLNSTIDQSITIILGTEDFEGVSFTAAQRDAAKSIAALAMDPSKAMSALNNLKDPSTSGEVANVDAMSLGIEDYIDPSTLSVEAFDGQAINDAVYFSIASNLMSAKQDAFGEAFYPTIAIDPTSSGLAISTEFTSLYTQFDRSISGSSDKAKFNKQPLVKVIYDNNVFGVDKNRVVPVSRPENAAVVLGALSYVETVSGEEVITAPLVFGETISLLGISQTDALLAKGAMDVTDALDRTVNLEKAYFSLTGSDGTATVTEMFVTDVSALPYSNFTYGTQDHEKDLLLNFNTTSISINTTSSTVSSGAASTILPLLPANHTVMLDVKLVGDGNTQYGDIAVYGVSIKIDKILDAAGNVLPSTAADYLTIKTVIDSAILAGYTLEAYRTNSNLRTKGQTVTSDKYTQLYAVPLRSGITVTMPINNASGADNDSKLVSQVQTVGMRVSMGAVQQLIKTSDLLMAVTNNGTISNTTVLGVGRYHVDSYYSNIQMNLVDYVDSLSSTDRQEDIKAALVNKIKDEVIKAYVDSNYNVANEVLRGNIGGKVTVIIGTDTRIKQYLTSGDGKVDIGEEFDVKVVATPNTLISNNMYITFGVYDSERNTKPNPLNFGQCAWAPTITTDVSRTVGGATVRELFTMPRYAHITNLPVLVNISVSGINSVIGKITTNRRTVV